jgi:hypothetical protein
MAGTSDDARSIADKVSVFLTMFHSAEGSVGSHGSDPDVKALFDSLQVRQEDQRAIVSATLPLGFLRKMLSGSSDELPSLQSSPAQESPARR